MTKTKYILSIAIVAMLIAAVTAGAATYAVIKPGSVDHTKLSNGLNTERTSNLKRLAALETKIVPAGVNGTNGSQGLKGDTGATGAQGPKGETGAKGATGDAVLDGAYWAIAYYDVGDTNGGALATVGCKATTDNAISGGVSVDDYQSNVPVGQSFPGREDWDGADDVSGNADDNTPRPGRLDGWIVQFASQNSSAPKKVKVYALCVPGLSVPSETTFQESAG